MKINTTGKETIIIRDTSDNQKHLYLIKGKKGPRWAVQYNIKNQRFQFYFDDKSDAIRARNVIDGRMPRIKAAQSRDEMMDIINEPITLFKSQK